MTTIWLARHAETALPTVFHGAESDVGLSEHGRRQAIAAAGWFRQLRLTAVVSSTMLRARDTAAPIAERCGVPHLVEPELHERRVGALSGTSFSSEGGPWAETMQRWMNGETTYTSPGAESFDQLRARLVPAFERIATAHPGGRVLVVVHGVVSKVLLLSLLPEFAPSDWLKIGRAPNLSVSELTHCGTTWIAGPLLTVPPPVAELSDGAPTGVGEKSQG